MDLTIDVERLPARVARAPAAHWLPAACTALLVAALSACGGGGDDGTVPSAHPGATDEPAASSVPPAPALRLAGTARTIDTGASGRPDSLRLSRSANGDGVAVWLADDGQRHNLWANRYRAAVQSWGEPVNIEASDTNVDDFDVATDASGNAVVVWHEGDTGAPESNGLLMSARLDAVAGAWTPPFVLNTVGSQPRVASNAAGTVLAVYVGPFQHIVRGRFLDTAAGTWQPEDEVQQDHTGSGFSASPAALLDAGGNALVAFLSLRTAAGGVSSNYFDVDGGGWARLGPDEIGALGGVPGSFNVNGGIGAVQLAASADGNFVAAWESGESWGIPELNKIQVARFTSRTRTWSTAQTLVPADEQKNVRFQRLGSDAAGNTFLSWTQNEGQRTALMALRLDHDGAVCTAAHEIDMAVGGGAARADLGVDERGDALVLWQQFEGGRPDDGSRSNIGVNRFDVANGGWASAVFAETQPGSAISPRVSVQGGGALLGWIQADDGGTPHVRALLQPLPGGEGP